MFGVGVIDFTRRSLAPQRPYDAPAALVRPHGVRSQLGAAIEAATAISAEPKGMRIRAIDLGVGALLGGLSAEAWRRGRFARSAAAATVLWALGDEFLLPLVSMRGEPWRYSVMHQLFRIGERLALAGAVAAVVHGTLHER
jgi:hypothetical protein